MAFGTALLASAGLLLHSFVKVMRADRGYQVERVLAVDLSLFGERYSSGESRVAFYREVSANVRSLPGVLAAGAISNLPATASDSGASRAVFYETDSDFRERCPRAAGSDDSQCDDRLFCGKRKYPQGGAFLC